MKIDYNSPVNQEIKRQLVEREIKANINSMVEYILMVGQEHVNAPNEPPFTYDDVENNFVQVCEECHEQGEFKELDNSLWQCASCGHVSENEPDSEAQEVYEWWLVTDWLADKLAAKGEVVIRAGSLCDSIWGRCCTGQAILLDGVISKIAEEMGILAGQPNSWAKK